MKGFLQAQGSGFWGFRGVWEFKALGLRHGLRFRVLGIRASRLRLDYGAYRLERRPCKGCRV